jgi:hypothetical protein
MKMLDNLGMSALRPFPETPTLFKSPLIGQGGKGGLMHKNSVLEAFRNNAVPETFFSALRNSARLI